MFSALCEQSINSSYQAFLKEMPELGNAIQQKIAACTSDEAILIKYLYGNMPISDMVSYPFETFMDYAEHGAFLWSQGYGKGIPEQIFLDHVVFHRINTEDISSCRTFFYNELKSQVTGKTMADIVREVNYWCASQATYQTTDYRTASPMTVYRNAVGRCGEESTFTVSALRSMGIPARQVYAPWWSHCDDNHAWVEAWCDGQWCFLGACEPEEILNNGWFTNASSRAMMVFSRTFGDQKNEGEIFDRKDCITLENQLFRYAKTARLVIRVKGEEGHSLAGVKVVCSLLNYAEFAPFIRCETDQNGECVITTGLGSIHVDLFHDGKFQGTEILVKGDMCVSILLKKEPAFEGWRDFEFYAPEEQRIHRVQISKAKREDGERKLKEAVAKRHAKVAGFYPDGEELFVEKSRGNAAELKVFLDTVYLSGCESEQKWKEALLLQLSEKDFWDVSAQTLKEHLTYAVKHSKDHPSAIFEKYVLNPRIYREKLHPYREFILTYFTAEERAEFLKAPKRIWEWISEHIEDRTAHEYEPLLTTVTGSLRYKTAGVLSRQILFVAICRTLGIPARLRPADQAMEYYDGAVFRPIFVSEEKTASIILKTEDQTKWTYRQNVSIALRSEEGYHTLDLSTEIVDSARIPVVPGSYRVVVTNRLPNGSQLARTLDVNLSDGEERQVELVMRSANLSDLLEEIVLDDFSLHTKENGVTMISDLVKEKPCVLMWLEESREPTEHILNELYELREEFAEKQAQIFFIVKNNKSLTDPTLSKCQKALPAIHVCFDSQFADVPALARRIYVDPDKLPLIMVVAPGMKNIYGVSGYNVGTAKLLQQILSM